MANNWKGIIFDRLENKPKKASSSFETDDFYEAALARSAKEAKTAAEDEEIWRKMEALKERIGQG